MSTTKLDLNIKETPPKRGNMMTSIDQPKLKHLLK